jgi:hypothetical protein
MRVYVKWIAIFVIHLLTIISLVEVRGLFPYNLIYYTYKSDLPGKTSYNESIFLQIQSF